MKSIWGPCSLGRPGGPLLERQFVQRYPSYRQGGSYCQNPLRYLVIVSGLKPNTQGQNRHSRREGKSQNSHQTWQLILGYDCTLILIKFTMKVGAGALAHYFKYVIDLHIDRRLIPCLMSDAKSDANRWPNFAHRFQIDKNNWIGDIQIC